MLEALRLPDPSLVVLVGASASGKSTWAAAHFHPDQVVSADRLRAVVGEGEHDQSAGGDAFAVLQLVVEARMRRRLTTVVDTLGLDAGRRGAWRALAARARVHCVAVTFDVPAAQCRRRNAARARSVPAKVLSRQLADAATLLPLLGEEGFDEVLPAQPVRVVAPSVASAARAATTAAGPAAAAGPAPAAGPAAAASTSGGVRFGLHLSSFGVPGGPAALGEHLSRVAAAAEDAGFTSVSVMDHLRQVPQLGRPWEDLPESTTTLGYLAAATRTARLGCLVHCVTYRNLGLLAKQVATLDVLSGGRAWCGLGAGWFEAEHHAYGWPFPPAVERLDLVEDALRLLPLMWGPGSPSFAGLRVQVPEAFCYPRPLQPHVPVLVGGSGERRTLRLVARHADACNLTGDADTVRRKVAVLHAHCADAGRDPAEVEVTHLSTALVARDDDALAAQVAQHAPPRGRARWTAWTNPGTVRDHVLRVRHLQDVGVQHVMVSLVGVWDTDAVARFGEVVAACG